jgi:hypothetical protein
MSLVSTNISITYKNPEDARESSSASASASLVDLDTSGIYREGNSDLKIGDKAHVAIFAPAGYSVIEIYTSDSGVNPAKSPKATQRFKVNKEAVKFSNVKPGEDNNASLPKINNLGVMPNIEWVGGKSMSVSLSEDGGSLIGSATGIYTALVSYEYNGMVFEIPPISENSIYQVEKEDGTIEVKASLDITFVLSKSS